MRKDCVSCVHLPIFQKLRELWLPICTDEARANDILGQVDEYVFGKLVATDDKLRGRTTESKNV